MRCYCCDNILTPREATRKFKESDTYTDTCDKCLNEIADIETVDGEGTDDELFDDDGNPVEE